MKKKYHWPSAYYSLKDIKALCKRYVEWLGHLLISRWPHLVIGATQRKCVMILQKSFTTTKRKTTTTKTTTVFLWESALQPSSCTTWSLIYGVSRSPVFSITDAGQIVRALILVFGQTDGIIMLTEYHCL